MGIFSFFSKADYPSVNQYEAIEIAEEQKKFKLLDIRTSEEFRQGSLKGAINIDLNDKSFVNKAETIDKDEHILVYCKSGVRSKKACSILKEHGFTNVYNLKGGITRWKGDYKVK